MQVITSIPASMLPKCMTAGTVTQEQLEIIDRGDTSTQEFVENLNEDMGQILWVRGLTRLQNQVRNRFAYSLVQNPSREYNFVDGLLTHIRHCRCYSLR